MNETMENLSYTQDGRPTCIAIEECDMPETFSVTYGGIKNIDFEEKLAIAMLKIGYTKPYSTLLGNGQFLIKFKRVV